jgi:hypothetical protein
VADSNEGHQRNARRGGERIVTQLERECRVYTRYLIRQNPTPYVIEKYKDFHEKSEAAKELDSFDLFLVKTSARGSVWARLADSYASRFRKDSALRKKLILTVALLECTAPAYARLDLVPPGGFPGAAIRLGLSAIGYAAAVLVAAAIFTPVRLSLKPRER